MFKSHFMVLCYTRSVLSVAMPPGIAFCSAILALLTASALWGEQTMEDAPEPRGLDSAIE
jgi:hypothetical protein